MSYQSGDKKNILGNRLSNRYLSSDAFTSSAGKTSGRSISRLGSLFKAHKSGRRFSGTGQKVGLFELKNIVVKIFFICTCLIVLGYTMPSTRYAIHAFFAQRDIVYVNGEAIEDVHDELLPGEYYVSPALLKTDKFIVNVDEGLNIEDGTLVFASPMNTLVGIMEATASNTPRVILFSEVGFKNNFFFKNSSLGDVVMEGQTTGTDTSTTSTTTANVVAAIVPNFTSIIFEGLGYGQMLAKVPPQVTIEVGTVVYARTVNGLKPVGKVGYVETDNGSTFTNIYAQILTPPYAIYKVTVADPIN